LNKITKIIFVIVVAVIVGLLSIGAYSLVTSNTITVTPQATSILLSANDYTPSFGDTITLTATLADAVSGITVTFNANTVDIGTSDTTAGVATLSYTITGLDPVYIYCTIP
jgi:hypothetical protein